VRAQEAGNWRYKNCDSEGAIAVLATLAAKERSLERAWGMG